MVGVTQGGGQGSAAPPATTLNMLARLGLAFGTLGDPLAIWGLRRWFFPVSRLWAAADASGTDIDRFAGEALLRIGAPMRGYIAKRLGLQARARARLDAAEEAWDAGFFGTPAMRPATLDWLERERKRLSQSWMATRIGYQPLLVGRRLPSVRWAVPDRAAVERALGPALRDPAAAFDLRVRPKVELSPAYPGRGGSFRWLRFASPWPRLGDFVLARVSEPHDAAGAPTIVFGNGVFIEWDLLGDFSGTQRLLVERGFRVIELCSPWHGRRRPAGSYGGETFFATAPLGPIDLFVGQALESAVMVRWARQTYGGKVGVGGISMGALAAQLAIGYADRWPRDCRPDAALLIAHSGRLNSIAFEGALTRALKLPEQIRGAGWSEAEIEHVGSLLDPPDRPAIAPDSIVSVLASADRVMPIDEGLELGRRWGLPAENLFAIRQSHVVLAFSLRSDDRPIRRLKAILAR